MHKAQVSYEAESLLLGKCFEDANVFFRAIRCVRAHQSQPIHHLDALAHPSKNSMLALTQLDTHLTIKRTIKPRRRRKRNKELTAVGVGARVGHRHDAGARVLQLCRNLIRKLVPINARSTAASALQ
jgi:hypothetical protein